MQFTRKRSQWSIWSILLVAAILTALEPPAARSQNLSIPDKPDGLVNDYASVIDDGVQGRLEAQLEQFERKTSARIIVAMFSSLEGENIEDFSNRTFEKWQLGHGEHKDAVLLVVFMKERKVRIEVSYGLEGMLTDALCARIIREQITPSFHAGRYADGIESAVASIEQAIHGEPDAMSGFYKEPSAGGNAPPVAGQPAAHQRTNAYQIPVIVSAAILYLLVAAFVLYRRRQLVLVAPSGTPASNTHSQPNHAPGRSHMSITLKEETILNQWSTLFLESASHATEYLDAVQGRLDRSQIPGECRWSLEEVKAGGLFAKTRREFLVVTNKDFSDYMTYIAARPYGIHLDVCRFTTVEPGFFKKAIAGRLTGDEAGLSAPKNILLEQDLRAYLTTIHHCCLSAADDLAAKIGLDPTRVNRQTQGALQLW